MMRGTSLFDASVGSALRPAVEWVTGTLLGSVATGICVLAVAAVGLMMLGGRLPVRRGARVILGCFVLLFAPVIGSGLAGQWSSGSQTVGTPEIALPEAPARRDLPPSDFDPYAGASLRQD